MESESTARGESAVMGECESRLGSRRETEVVGRDES